MLGLVTVISMAGLMILGAPIAVALGGSGLITLLASGNFSAIKTFPQRMFGAVDSFPLMAVIFFIVAGELMLQGGMSKRLVRLVNYFLARVRGSLAYISLVTSAFFGALSGSSLATTSAIGSIMYPEMLEDGTYDKSFGVAVMATGGTLGTMIPPSIPIVIFGMLANTSIGDMMLALIPAGILVTIFYCLAAFFVIKKRNMATKKHKQSDSFIKVFINAVPALLTPLIILGGIYTGVFSPTESAAIACVYALIIGVFFYRELTINAIVRALRNSAKATASIMFLCAAAGFLGWVLTFEGIMGSATGFLMKSINSPFTFFLFANIAYFIAGMFVDTATVQFLLTPLLFQVGRVIPGINMIHVGIVACINLSLGAITPPFGACMFVANGLDKSVRVEEIYKEVIPFIVAGIIGIAVLSAFPQTIMFMVPKR